MELDFDKLSIPQLKKIVKEYNLEHLKGKAKKEDLVGGMKKCLKICQETGNISMKDDKEENKEVEGGKRRKKRKANKPPENKSVEVLKEELKEEKEIRNDKPINQINPVLTNLPKTSVLNPMSSGSLAKSSPNFVKPYMQNIGTRVPSYGVGDFQYKKLIQVSGGNASYIDVNKLTGGDLLKNEEIKKILKVLNDNKKEIKELISKYKK
jgi:hypothetical protein